MNYELHLKLFQKREFKEFYHYKYISLCKTKYFNTSTVAGQIVLGAQILRVKPRGVPREKARKIFEIFTPEMAANALNFKN